MALVVVVGTAWALIQPASTMSGQIVCGMEEHTHTDACYERQLICGAEESEAHTHTESCWVPMLICTKPQHTHIDECYDIFEPENVYPENEETGETVCGMEEHTHTDACYERQLICGEEESEAHIHTDACWENVLVCSKPEHTHVLECYGSAENEKDPAVDPEDGNSGDVIETEPEAPPEEPEQGKDPSEENGEDSDPTQQDLLLEQLRKYIPEEYTDIREAQIPEGGAVYLFAQPGVIPEQVELKAQLVDTASEVFAQAEQRVKNAGVIYDYMQALDITLVDETGAEVEPIAPVYVSVDVGALLPEDVNTETIRIQHHKEILPTDNGNNVQNEAAPAAGDSEVVVESVLDDTTGTLTQIENTASFVATFPVDSFSVYTITSSGWPNLKIKVQCVDEFGNELLAEHKPDDTQWGDGHHPGATFSVIFMSNEHPKIDGYQYDNKAYFMRNGKYESRIYGISRSNNKWYYFPQDKDKNTKTEFAVQPNFEVSEGKDPPDFIRLVYKKVTEIPVQYIDDAGSLDHQEILLSQEDAPNGKNPDIINYTGTILDISNSDVMPKSDTYFYVGVAYAGEPEIENQVFQVIRENGKPCGVTEDKRKILITEDNPLKLMYHKTQTETPDIFNTVSTRDKGLTINLFDYISGENSGIDEGINAGKKLQFVQDTSRTQAYNKWTGSDGGIYTGILEPQLGADGYPRVKGESGEPGESLAYLFSPELCHAQLGKTVKHLHTDLDHLFWRDRDGYYRYDSMTNFATIMDSTEDGSGGHNPEHINGGNFVVYQQPALPGYSGTGDNPKFLPFNTYAEANTPTKKPAITDKVKQYHFGMTMEADFIMPPGGVIPDADGNYTGMRDMIFEFNGDDDVWVFIDGELALDLGGIHDRYGGTINFRTGEVTTNAPPMEHSGLTQKNLYGILDDPNTMTETQLAEAREKAGFGKFSQHNFKFFYLERGRGASNCEIRFNLVPVEHGLVVGKRLPETMDGAATEHMWYQFQAEAEHNGKRHPLANAPYSVIKWEPGEDPINGGHVVDGRKTDDQGRFWLRAGERADFMGAVDLKHAGIAEHDKVTIHISEIFQEDEIQPKVKAWSGKDETPGTYIEVKDENGQITRKQVPALYDSEEYKFHTEATKTNVTNGTLQTGEIAHQVSVTSGIHNDFNWIDFENDLGVLSGLNITKKACYTDGAPIPDVPFAIKVELWNKKEGNWIPLPVGSDYWILEENEKPEENTKLHLDQAAGGLIYIQDGQWIHLHTLPGTKYRVSEVLSTEDAAVYTTTYEGTTSSAGEEFEIFEEAGKQTGIGNKAGIAAGSQNNITITNKGNPILMPKGSFVLTKEVIGEIHTGAKFEFKLRILDYATEGDSYLQELPCEATYYGTPEGERPGNPNNGIKETLTFTPADTSGGTDGTPTRGENYESTLFLYPGEMVVIKGLPDGKAMYVQEVFTEGQTGHYTVSFQEEGQNEVSGEVLDGTVGTISKDALLKVTCRNTSNLQATSTLQISKTVKRTDQPNGEPTDIDKQKEFSFRITLKKPAGFAGGEIPAEIQAADGTKTPMPLNFTPSDEDYIADAKLKHGETLTINSLPIDIDVVVQEKDHQGYVVSMNGIPGDTVSVRMAQNTGAVYEVKCVNMTGVELPETGGHGLLPYYLAGSILLCTAGWLLYRRRRVHGAM